jgi:hypothetical protein
MQFSQVKPIHVPRGWKCGSSVIGLNIMRQENEECLQRIDDEKFFGVREDVVFVGEMPACWIVFHGGVEKRTEH